MRKKISVLFLLFFLVGFSQYRNNTNHQKDIKYVSPIYSLGENNIGLGIDLGYFISPKMGIELSSIYRKFSYKSYKEDIIEVALQGKYTVIQPRYYDRIFRNFNIQMIAGVAVEVVKVTSKTILIEKYPKYIYGLAGVGIEYTLNRNFSLVSKFRQFYAFNGDKDKLGFTRYDFNLGLTYYFK